MVQINPDQLNKYHQAYQTRVNAGYAERHEPHGFGRILGRPLGPEGTPEPRRNITKYGISQWNTKWESGGYRRTPRTRLEVAKEFHQFCVNCINNGCIIFTKNNQPSYTLVDSYHIFCQLRAAEPEHPEGAPTSPEQFDLILDRLNIQIIDNYDC